jgi:hypothetical protein
LSWDRVISHLFTRIANVKQLHINYNLGGERSQVKTRCEAGSAQLVLAHIRMTRDSKNWQYYLAEIEKSGWRVKCREREGFDGNTHWCVEARKDRQTLSVSATNLDETIMKVWQMV